MRPTHIRESYVKSVSQPNNLHRSRKSWLELSKQFFALARTDSERSRTFTDYVQVSCALR